MKPCTRGAMMPSRRQRSISAFMACVRASPSERNASGYISLSVEGASPTSRSTSCQYSGWEVY